MVCRMKTFRRIGGQRYEVGRTELRPAGTSSRQSKRVARGVSDVCRWMLLRELWLSCAQERRGFRHAPNRQPALPLSTARMRGGIECARRHYRTVNTGDAFHVIV